jgi:hypothetical protein
MLAFTHEIGHNFGSDHTQCYSPPVDECFICNSDPSVLGTCPPLAIENQRAATIMSYCHNCGAETFNNVAYTFGGHYDDLTSTWVPNAHIASLGFSFQSERVPEVMHDFVSNVGTCVDFTPPPPPPCSSAGCQGDPHFKTWRGQHFDFHGECDLVLLHNSAFESGLGLDVHIRTKIRRDMSFISSAALRIGSDILEVESQGVYYLNGVLSAALPAKFSGFVFSHTQPTDKQHAFEVYLGGRERIKLKTYKDFVSVLIEQGQNKHLGGSVGLMGDFRTGNMIARDGKTDMSDANAFGQEWQVLDTEPSLFQNVRFPQHPQKCTLPSTEATSVLRRRLAESSDEKLAAEKACAHWGEGKNDCVFDVMTTGDLEMALVGAY